MTTRHAFAGVPLLALAVTGCLRLDVFVFREKPAADDADLLATSRVPADLHEEVKGALRSADGTVVDAYLLKHRAGDGTPENRHRTGVLYTHGQSTHIGTTVPRLDALWKLGYVVLAYDARGYGKTLGTPTEETVYADARAARSYLEGRQDLGLSPDRVALYGRSLGTLFTTKIAAERPPKALVLESPVLSIQTIIDDSLALDTPVQWYVDSAMDNGVELPKYTGALLIMHGDADDFVQPAYGRHLHDLAEGHARPNEFWLVPGASHGTVPCVSNVPSAVDNDCTGGFSDGYATRVGRLIDDAIGLSP